MAIRSSCRVVQVRRFRTFFCMGFEYANGDEIRFHSAINEMARRQSGGKPVVVRAILQPVLDVDVLARIALLLIEDQTDQDELAA